MLTKKQLRASLKSNKSLSRAGKIKKYNKQTAVLKAKAKKDKKDILKNTIKGLPKASISGITKPMKATKARNKRAEAERKRIREDRKKRGFKESIFGY